MKINQTQIDGKWLEIKGEILKAWGKITNDEIEQTKGDLTSIAGLVHQKYGEGQEKFHVKISSIFESFNKTAETTIENIKENLKSK